MKGMPRKAGLSFSNLDEVNFVSRLPIVAAARDFREPAQFDPQARILEMKITKKGLQS